MFSVCQSYINHSLDDTSALYMAIGWKVQHQTLNDYLSFITHSLQQGSSIIYCLVWLQNQLYMKS